MRRHELALRLANAQSVKRTYLSKLEKAASYPGREIIAKLVAVLAVDSLAANLVVERTTGEALK